MPETKIQYAFAWLLFICGCGVGYLSFGESLLHVLCDVMGWKVHPVTNTGRMQGLVAIITVVAGAQSGVKYIDYKRDRDCVYKADNN